jgi:hypothetical protein
VETAEPATEVPDVGESAEGTEQPEGGVEVMRHRFTSHTVHVKIHSGNVLDRTLRHQSSAHSLRVKITVRKKHDSDRSAKNHHASTVKKHHSNHASGGKTHHPNHALRHHERKLRSASLH